MAYPPYKKINTAPPPAKTIAVDVDGTLISDSGELNGQVVSFCRRQKEEGYFLILWSARGHDHALATAEQHNLLDLFNSIISKPGFIIDDRGWSWIKYTQVIQPQIKNSFRIYNSN